MKNAPARLFGWDIESTGVDVHSDRILTCYAALQNAEGEIEEEWHWTIDPGTEIPTGASDVHGMTTEWIREHGRKDVQLAIEEIARTVTKHAFAKIPVVAYNLRYDFSILNAERLRHTGYSMNDALKAGSFLDPLVWDKARDKYRKGNRKLQTVCEHYGIDFNEDEAHAAEYDVKKTLELAWKFVAKEKLSIADLQDFLRESKEEQDSSLEAYFKKSGKTNEDGSPIRIDRGWPLITKKGS